MCVAVFNFSNDVTIFNIKTYDLMSVTPGPLISLCFMLYGSAKLCTVLWLLKYLTSVNSCAVGFSLASDYVPDNTVYGIPGGSRHA